MKMIVNRLLLIAALGALIFTGCSSRRAVVVTPDGQVIAPTAPPPAKHETVMGTAPSASHTWVEGYWFYQNGRYVWVPGKWELRPRATAVWVPGRWERTSAGYVWRPGHWE